jgi:hypothetical protein
VRGSRSQTLDLVHVRFTSAGWCRSGGCVAREPTVVDGHAVARKSAKSALSVGFMSANFVANICTQEVSLTRFAQNEKRWSCNNAVAR